MNANCIFNAFEMIDDTYILEARERNATHAASAKPAGRKGRNFRRTLAIAVGIMALLTLCGFAAFELGFFDPWLQTPAADPTETVRSAIEKQIEKEYTVAVRIDEIKVDEAETQRVANMYSGSELAEARGWTDGYLAERFVVVWTKYYVEYDHTKTFMSDGETEQYFYLTENLETGEWTIIDNTGPNVQ